MLAHLSDTHLRHPDDPLVRGLVDPRPHLIRALAAVETHAPRALVFTGDLSDDGTPESTRNYAGSCCRWPSGWALW